MILCGCEYTTELDGKKVDSTLSFIFHDDIFLISSSNRATYPNSFRIGAQDCVKYIISQRLFYYVVFLYPTPPFSNYRYDLHFYKFLNIWYHILNISVVSFWRLT